jgi:Tfp pilus assembly protein PilE
MAVLVGVLAPAYLKYVEKSRKSTDVSAVADIITAASTVAADVEYEVAAGDTFTLDSTAKGSIILKVTTTDSQAEDGWKDVANAENGYKFASKAFKAETGTAKGVVQTNGSVQWKRSDATGVYDSMAKYSKDLASKFES